MQQYLLRNTLQVLDGLFNIRNRMLAIRLGLGLSPSLISYVINVGFLLGNPNSLDA